ncbi:MAG: hypothetical protein M1829_006700 [Trizodia sp. TS-e1964]|nr:MAG: hypothetical protein M1829_006700 [Trizodia sp. TS-e1964]
MSDIPQSLPPPPPRWVIDLDSKPVPKAKSSSLPDPPGYSAPTFGNSKRSAVVTKGNARKPPTAEETDLLKIKKSWEVALGPAKQLPMTAIMMYMSGNTLQIFSVMMVFMAFQNPIKALIAINQAFARFETEGTKGRLWIVKGVYVLMQIVALAMGIWKVNAMGLLPTTRSDWLAWETEREPLETAIHMFR